MVKHVVPNPQSLRETMAVTGKPKKGSPHSPSSEEGLPSFMVVSSFVIDGFPTSLSCWSGREHLSEARGVRMGPSLPLLVSRPELGERRP